MKWYFPPQLPGQVETEVTQRDQFSNDEVDISETIVREAIQNSLDAAVDDSSTVTVSFQLITMENGLEASFCKELLEEQLIHAREAGLEIDEIDFDAPTALIIEDFGTKGLTGKIDGKDDCDFSDFWRRHGKSHKTGKSQGRWGLGKLVYSITSRVGAFFGTTVTRDDPVPRLMGQTVLNLRTVDGNQYPPHAFFADVENQDDIFRALPVPVKDPAFVSEFSQQFSLDRGDQPGLSVIIPFPQQRFKREQMIAVAIINYFYPIICRKLILRFGGWEINQSNIRELAHKYANDGLKDIDALFNFIEEVKRMEDGKMLEVRPSWANDQRLDENDFDPEDLIGIRERFEARKIVGLRLPVMLKKKDGTRITTSFSAYVQRPPDIEKGMDLYVRGGLTLPAESKFRERKAFGAMIAEEDAICSFLGDAENAAHTRWIGSAEKVRKNYQNPQKTIRVIKQAVVDFHDLLAEVTEEVDEQALQSFFWYDEPESGKKKKRRGITPIEIPKPPIPRPPMFRITETRSGFTVVSTKKADPKRLPRMIRIEAAYDVTRGNPFKRYSPLDFRLGRPKNVRLEMSTETSKLIEARDNVLRIEVAELPFRLKATGFDENRDLKVRLTMER